MSSPKSSYKAHAADAKRNGKVFNWNTTSQPETPQRKKGG